MRDTRRIRRAAALTLISCAACSEATTGPAPDAALQVRDEAGVVVMTQSVVPADFMSALFEGRVLEDAEGCLRLEGPDAHTVIWPLGYRAAAAGAAVVIRDGEGVAVGEVGGTFSLGGGEVTELSDAMGFDQSDRDLAAARCPGRYWIVSP